MSLLKDNWRFVADVNELSSLTFRLAFADTFGDAINSEVRSSIFLTHNFDGFSFNVAALNDNELPHRQPGADQRLSAQRAGSAIQLRRAGAVANVADVFRLRRVRRRRCIATMASSTRPPPCHALEFAPRVTVPFHFGPWLDVTATAAFRTTYYGDSLVPGSILTTPVLSGVFDHPQRRRIRPRFPACRRHSALFPTAWLNEKIQAHDRAVL